MKELDSLCLVEILGGIRYGKERGWGMALYLYSLYGRLLLPRCGCEVVCHPEDCRIRKHPRTSSPAGTRLGQQAWNMGSLVEGRRPFGRGASTKNLGPEHGPTWPLGRGRCPGHDTPCSSYLGSGAHPVAVGTEQYEKRGCCGSVNFGALQQEKDMDGAYISSMTLMQPRAILSPSHPLIHHLSASTANPPPCAPPPVRAEIRTVRLSRLLE
ncbi:hypothetical protein B0T26DRAFT_14202 [Lasiosphaeria miniovina]|uniref:Uncharacterized protein n=1 Tax=Lasiosphaeria miniovina TaxID=1954250 RepID=A0AA40BFN3_9PEZI|nr:uncharacterized protein B0T26DRAFT_14202 [Lasiosphaeria miniovina]KAK0733362.1 hypothetical protein B0T26DRAFT_14202 [Lasiosphaeria miniovina]